jgi:hypothetical protein
MPRYAHNAAATIDGVERMSIVYIYNSDLLAADIFVNASTASISVG